MTRDDKEKAGRSQGLRLSYISEDAARESARKMIALRCVGSIIASATAAGISAHLMATNLDHDGSLRDIAVLVSAIALALGLSRAVRATSWTILGAVMLSVCVGVGWLFLENPAHVQFAQICSTLFSLVPISCALVLAVLLFAKAAVTLTRFIVELVLRIIETRLHAPASYRFVVLSPKTKRRDPRLRSLSRRGPPAALELISVRA